VYFFIAKEIKMGLIGRTDDDFGNTAPLNKENHEEVLKKYRIVEETKWYMDYGDFERLVKDHLPELTNQERYKDFESVAEFEWNNYSNYDTEVTKVELEDDMYIKYDRKDIMNGKFGLGFNSILTFLVENKILPAGKYSVEVFW